MPGKRQLGFTLTELVIVIAILAIIAVIAVPNYQTYMMKSRRSAAISTLLGMQMAEEKHRANNATYGTITTVWGGVSATDDGFYALTITGNTAIGFVVTATGQNGQQSDKQGGTGCSPLSLTINGAVTTKAPAACWD